MSLGSKDMNQKANIFETSILSQATQQLEIFTLPYIATECEQNRSNSFVNVEKC